VISRDKNVDAPSVVMIEKHLFAALFLVRNIGVQENPGILNDKTAIFDVYGTLSLVNPF